MEHMHNIIDTDVRFSIDAIHRRIKSESKKLTLMQGDHNSERFTFEIPRYIEGHDMTLCNKVEVHYLNTATKEKEKGKVATGKYDVEDLQISPEDEAKVLFSWLISKNATKYAGVLSFRIKFRCIEHDIETYSWNTEIFIEIKINDGINADESFEIEYVDIIEQWKAAVKSEFSAEIDDLGESLKTELSEWEELESGKIRGEMTAYSAQWNQALSVERERIDNIVALPEGSTTGDAELLDIRVGADGVTYDSAGAAVREQFNRNVDSIIDVEWIDAALLYPTNGYVTSDDINFSATNYFSVVGSKYITAKLQGRKKSGVAFYDKHMNYLSGLVFEDNKTIDITVSVPSSAWFCRCGTYTEAKEESFVSCPVSINNVVSIADFEMQKSTQARITGVIVNFDECEKGYITPSGGIELKGKNNERHSDLIPVKEGEQYLIDSWTSAEPWIGLGLYDKNGIFIKRETGFTSIKTLNDGTIHATRIYTVESGIGFVLFSGRKYDGIVTVSNIDDSVYASAIKIKAKSQPNYNFCESGTNIKSVNHRGYNFEAPENTLSAYKLSKKKGFNIVEADISFTVDGIPVLLHDDTIDRTSNGTGAISELTFGYVRGLDFGGWFNEKYSGEQIPSFDEFVRFCKCVGLHPYIELKPNGSYTEENIRTVINIVKKYAMLNNVTFISFNLEYLIMLKNVNDAVRLGYIISGSNLAKVTEATSLLTGKNEVFIDADFQHITQEFVEKCKNENIPLEVWTVNNTEDIIALDSYISGVTSDNLLASEVMTAQYQ